MSRFRSIARWSAYLSLIGAALFVGGFFWFVHVIDQDSAELPAKADGIVVLTGGSSRILEAYRLLDAGRGKRLLITGVYERTTREELKRLLPNRQSAFDCCVDLDRKAQDTIGNAEETSKWVSLHGFGSIIVVTSSYHMMRSLTELQRVMPDITLIPHSVKPKNFHLEDWWFYPRTAKLLVSEYVKFLASAGRLGACRLARQVYSDGDVSQASSH